MDDLTTPPGDRTRAAWQRLFGPADEPAALLDGQARTRALVLELVQPQDWAPLAALWRQLQAELGLPAPAFAVSGTDALQLWLALAEPVPAARGHAFLEALRRHGLSEVPPTRVRLWPAPDADAPGGWRHALPVPAEVAGGDRWSALVAPDLVPVFAETPWLEMPPSDDGQAQLLTALKPITLAALAAAEAALAPAAVADPAAPAGPEAAPAPSGDPVAFLLRVMHDEAAPLALRVDAAKALLPYLKPRA